MAQTTETDPKTSEAKHLRRLIETHGGFTVDLREGLPVDSGISVAAQPSRTLSFEDSEWCDHQVTEWLTEVKNHPGFLRTHIGGWQDPANGSIHLDVVVVVPGFLRWAARGAGRFFGQHCVFDLGRKETMVLR